MSKTIKALRSLNFKKPLGYSDQQVNRVGYKTLRGFISMIKKQNNNLKKMGCKVTFTITLPIKE